MNQLLVVAVTAVAVGCANTTTRPDDAFEPSPDVGVIQDAGVDAPTLDAPNLDAFIPDAFILPREVCNGIDDDFDTATDEGGTAQCRMQNHAEMAACEMGRCVCRPSGTLATYGTFDDCNADYFDGCEVQLGTDENCRACGDSCDLASTCRFHEGTGFACGPADILDFSTASIRSDIACIVRTDHRVICRGPNTDRAISDEAPETATLPWTEVIFPPVRFITRNPRSLEEVRVWQHQRPDGREVMSICILDRANESLACRGDDSTELLGPGEALTFPNAFAGSQWSNWGGEGVIVNSVSGDVRVEIWGGRRFPSPFFDTWRGEAPRFSRGDIPIFTSPPYRFRETVPWTFFVVTTWGHAPSWLLADPNVDSDIANGAWTGTLARDLPTRDADCSRDVCCLVHPEPSDHIRVGCWGRHLRARDEVTWVDGLPEVAIPVGSGATVAQRRLIELFPRADGRIEGCVRIDGRFFCADMTTAADTLGPVSPEPFHEEPTRVFGGRTPQARVDWQAMCLQHRPDWWQCWGTHEGWGRE